MDIEAQEQALKSALKRIARMHDWCSFQGQLPNIAADIKCAIREVEGVIYALQKAKKIEIPTAVSGD